MEFSSGASSGPQDALLQDLVLANHIIHHNGVVDAFGHISTRHPGKPDVFIMSANMAPALVSGPRDFVEYRVADSTPCHKNAPKGFIERFIHSEIYKRYSNVNCVIHSHAEDVLPFTVSGVPFRPVFHMAGFLGSDVPIFDIDSVYQDGESQDLLVNSCRLGADLAATFSSTMNDVDGIPEHAVALMRRHGFTTVGGSIKEAVFRAVFTIKNAKAQITSALLRHSFDSSASSNSSLDNRATIHSKHPLEPLTPPQTVDSAKTTTKVYDRPWGLWVREVQCQSLYENRKV